jgi:hypothetical protein
MMEESEPLRSRIDCTVRIWADTLTYSVVVAALIVLGAVVLSVVTGGGLARANILVFTAGWIQLSYATVVLWPTSPDDLESTTDQPTVKADDMSTKVQSIARSLPPLRWLTLPRPEDRMLSLCL